MKRIRESVTKFSSLPRPVRTVFVANAVMGLFFALTALLWLVGALPSALLGRVNPDVSQAHLLVVVACPAALWLLITRSRFAQPANLGVFLAGLYGIFTAATAATAAPLSIQEPARASDSAWSAMISPLVSVGLQPDNMLIALPLLIAAAWFVKSTFFKRGMQAWCRLEPEGRAAALWSKPARSTWVKHVLVAGFVVLVYDLVRLALGPVQEGILVWSNFVRGLGVTLIDDASQAAKPWIATPDAAFFAGLLVLVVAPLLRVTVDESGVRLFVWQRRFALLYARWTRVRFLDVCTHPDGRQSVVVRYFNRLGLPASVSIRSGGWENSEGLAGQAVSLAESAGLPIRSWQTRRGQEAWARGTFLCGAGLAVSGAVLMHILMRRLVDETVPVERMSEVLWLMPLAIMYCGALLFMGIGVGMTSVRHTGTGSLVGLTLWLCVSQLLPSPLIFWLVGVALYAIMSANLGPLAHVPHIQAMNAAQLDAALMLVSLALVFAGGGYVLGVMLGRSPFTLIRRPMPVGESRPVPTPDKVQTEPGLGPATLRRLRHRPAESTAGP